MADLEDLLSEKIEAAEAAMKRNLTTALYDGPSTDPRFAPLTPEQQARADGFYWVRHRNREGVFGAWRIDEWSHGAWSTCGSEESWRLEPDEIGPKVRPPSRARFDRTAYQREYMAKRRAESKTGKGK